MKVLHHVFIAGDVPSSKNSKRLVNTKGKGKARIIQSEASMAYVNSTAEQWRTAAPAFREAAKGLPRPLAVLFIWVRRTKQGFDHTGPLEMALDCMTGHKFKKLDIRYPGYSADCAFLPDDDTDDVCPGMWPIILYDKENPGTHILLLEDHPSKVVDFTGLKIF